LTDTRAQQLNRLFLRLDITQCRLATWMGVAENTVSRWLKKARADSAGLTARDGLEPDRSRVLQVRALVALRRTCPTLLTQVAWDERAFDDALAAVEGEPCRLAGERRPGEYGSLTVD